ncbi:hypothetical protein [Sandarakinorhabdus sp.]|uniref:hypothetical protein n=1 Tax=Sandarakinorhabdus sp. TaxID=1916663 RepID=UPI00286E1360|nr:hypothetical protein [Sandarakinorhabdus sp.]
MIPRSAIALASFIFLSAAAPDPILNRVITEARANPPTSLAFERQTRTVSQENGGENESQLRVDRWDGRIFTLVSINGKPPAAKEADSFRKAAGARPVPGYYRIADLLKAGAVRLNDPQGRLVYRVTGLPKGTISVGKDVSANVMADFFVDASGAQPYVTRTRTVLIKPLSFFMVAKLDSLEIINDYKLDGNGKPYLAHATQAIAGAQFGKQGTTRIESNYSMLR